MRGEEADEVDDTKSDAAVAVMFPSLGRPTLRSMYNEFAALPELDTELSADAVEQMRLSVTGSLMHTLQQQDR